jgi:hypothetical protein
MLYLFGDIGSKGVGRRLLQRPANLGNATICLREKVESMAREDVRPA